MRGSNRSMQTGGLTAPTWTELSTNEAGSWTHTDGYDYVVIEGIRVERAQNSWFTFEPPTGGLCSGATCGRESNTRGPGGQAATVTFTTDGFAHVGAGTFGSGHVTGDWYIACYYAWVETGTLNVRITVRAGSSPKQEVGSNITLTTTPTEYCIRMQDDGTAQDDWIYPRIYEDTTGDGTGVEFEIGYLSVLLNSIASTPIKNHSAGTSNTAHVQREADVLPFSTKDLSVESGEGQVDVAWLNYPYNWPATPTVKTIVDLLEAADWRVIYDRPDASTNEIQFDAGGASVAITTTFVRGDVARLTIRWRSGEPLQLCVDGVCATSAGNYTPPAGFDTNGCWGCHDPDGTPGKFLDGGLREARLR